MIWSFIFFQGIFVCVTIFAAEENRDSRSAYFTTRKNKQLVGHVVKQFESPSFMSCSQSCLRNSWCTSTNFKVTSQIEDKGTCELNNNEIAPVNQDTYLIDQPGVTFSMFLKGCLMTGCLNGGSCLFDKKKETFTCSCKLPWSGDECDVKMVLYNFTTLGATGRIGPVSNAGYSNTPLQDVQIKDGKQEWQVPITGKFLVEACGASGGDGSSNSKGGKGAKVSGVLTLTKGDKLGIVVGQKGSTFGDGQPGSGGGGTFVFRSSDINSILVAGGGGGGGSRDGLSGNDLPAGSGGAAGSNGTGGAICRDSGGMYSPDSGAGAGYFGAGGCLENGRSCGTLPCNKGGGSFNQGFKGGDGATFCSGGFGGGGACGVFPGGGGGYSGGGLAPEFVAGGGGSYKPDHTWSVIKGGCEEGDGYVSYYQCRLTSQLRPK